MQWFLAEMSSKLDRAASCMRIVPTFWATNNDYISNHISFDRFVALLKIQLWYLYVDIFMFDSSRASNFPNGPVAYTQLILTFILILVPSTPTTIPFNFQPSHHSIRSTTFLSVGTQHNLHSFRTSNLDAQSFERWPQLHTTQSSSLLPIDKQPTREHTRSFHSFPVYPAFPISKLDKNTTSVAQQNIPLSDLHHARVPDNYLP